MTIAIQESIRVLYTDNRIVVTKPRISNSSEELLSFLATIEIEDVP